MRLFTTLFLVVNSGFLLLGQEPTPVSVKISTDWPAEISLDGKPVGVLSAGQSVPVETTPGFHELVAVPQGRGPVWQKKILVSAALPAPVTIPLRAHVLRTEIQAKGYWTDDRSKLTWAAADSGAGVTLSQAHLYCRELTTGGFRDWRLPQIEELQPLFGGLPDERGYRLVVPLKLTGWTWSATLGNEPAENWTIDFADGARASVVAGDAGPNRALCVRSPQTGR